MSIIRLALKARKFFPNAPRKQAASQAVKYAKAVAYLGERWLAIRKCERLEEPRFV
jgi:hypothetical protein